MVVISFGSVMQRRSFSMEKEMEDEAYDEQRSKADMVVISFGSAMQHRSFSTGEGIRGMRLELSPHSHFPFHATPFPSSVTIGNTNACTFAAH